MYKTKKAFTLMELLVVVLILGVLSSVAVPKMKRVLETRKTTEAENMLAALRTEQEARCLSGKDYLTAPAKTTTLAASSNSPNFSFSLNTTGANAASNAKDYTIRMLSYKEGSFCCEGSYCESLNKGYPLCSSLTIPSDECAGEPCQAAADGDGLVTSKDCPSGYSGTQTRVWDENLCAWSGWDISTCVCNPVADGDGTNTSKTCPTGYTGTQTRSWQTNSCSWSAWDSSACVCSPTADADGTSTSKSCPTGYTGTQTRSWQAESCSWSAWDTSACVEKPACDTPQPDSSGSTKTTRYCYQDSAYGEMYLGRQFREWNTSTCSWSAWDTSGCYVDKCADGVNSSEWSSCCTSGDYDDTRCYKACSTSMSGWTGSYTYTWGTSGTSCNSGSNGGTTVADSISCGGYSGECNETTAGMSCCNNGTLKTCVRSGTSTSFTVAYYCKAYAKCSTSCAGYHSVSSGSSGGSSDGSSSGSSGGSSWGGGSSSGGSGGSPCIPGIVPGSCM